VTAAAGPLHRPPHRLLLRLRLSRIHDRHPPPRHVDRPAVTRLGQDPLEGLVVGVVLEQRQPAAGPVEGVVATPVASIQVNDGSAQRSEVRSLTVTFAQAVTVAGSNAAAAFTLTRVSDGQVVSLAQAAATTNAGGRTVVTLTFTNGHQALVDQLSTGNGGPPSLADGVYRLTIDDAAVTVNGAAFDGDENGTPGGDYVSPLDGSGWGAPPTFYHFGLYRLFGDATGDGTVDLIDLSYFRTTFNAGLGDPLFLAYMDAENNNMVDLFDLGEFRTRFNVSLFP
jgi:hypothetical protein